MAKIRKSDVAAVENKLREFGKGLPAQEQDVLNWLLARAKSAPAGELSDEALEAVAGGQDLASSLGFGPGEESISVGWSKSFDQD